MNDPDHTSDQHMPPHRDTRDGALGASPASTDVTAAEEDSALAKHRDPSRPPRQTTGIGQGRGNGITWVRPSELMVAGTSRIAGRGIDFQTTLVRQSRRLPRQTVAASRHAISERARRLPPLSAFGRTTGRRAGVGRSGFGLR